MAVFTHHLETVMILTPDNIRAAVVRHETIFFDADLQPITPAAGQWFCEYDIYVTYEGNEILRDEALVEFVETYLWKFSDGATVSQHLVCPENDEELRNPRGEALILQA